jgi:hypothetical protein
VIEEPVYLDDEEGAVEENVNYLPVIILEILSEGPGKVDRHFRIQVMANNGEKLGEADIVDDHDLKLVLGSQMKHLLQCDIEDRNMSEIFQYILQERIIINLLSIVKKVTASGRREGMRMEAAITNDPDHEEDSRGSVVILKKDSLLDFDESEASTDDDDDDGDGDGDGDENDEDQNGLTHLSLHYPSSTKYYWLRIYTTRHRMSGRGYRTVIILLSLNPLIISHSNNYFQRNSKFKKLQELFEKNEIKIIFNTNDLNGQKRTIRLFLRGKDCWKWLPKEIQENMKLTSSVKREKFGKWLCEQLRIQYRVMGDYVLELYGMDKELTRDQRVIEYGRRIKK